MAKINRFNDWQNQEYKTGDKVECVGTSCLANHGSQYNPKIGDELTVSIRYSPIDNSAEYYLINKDGKELTYPYKKSELQIHFSKI